MDVVAVADAVLKSCSCGVAVTLSATTYTEDSNLKFL